MSSRSAPSFWSSTGACHGPVGTLRVLLPRTPTLSPTPASGTGRGWPPWAELTGPGPLDRRGVGTGSGREKARDSPLRWGPPPGRRRIIIEGPTRSLAVASDKNLRGPGRGYTESVRSRPYSFSGRRTLRGPPVTRRVRVPLRSSWSPDTLDLVGVGGAGWGATGAEGGPRDGRGGGFDRTF